MQTVSQSMPGSTTGNIRPLNLPLHFRHPDSFSTLHNNSQFSASQKHQSPGNLGSNSNYATGSGCLLQRNSYSIHLVNSFKQRIKASTLIKRMYASRGYQTESTSVFSASSNQYTFEARQSQQLIGTLTLTIDTHNKLLADSLYRSELDQFRQKGRKLCELSKLAFNPDTSSKEIFASLFHMAYIFAYRIHDVDDAFIEINPRHAIFYKRMLGFRQIGELRTCPRVNAPAVLLHLDLKYMEEQIVAWAGQSNQKTKSIYPHFLSRNKEKEITHHIQTRCISTSFPPHQSTFSQRQNYFQLT